MAGKKGATHKKHNENSKRCIEFWKKEHPEWTIEQCEKAVSNFKKSCNYQCIEYYETNWPELSHNEHLELMKVNQISRRKNNPLYIEYYDLRYPELTQEQRNEMCKVHRKETCMQSKLYYAKNYSECTDDEQEELRKQYIASYIEKRPNQTGSNNPNHISKTTLLKRQQNSPWSIEFYNLRYPELTQEQRNEMLFNKQQDSRKKSISNCCLQYYVNKGMTIEEAKKALRKRQSTFTYDKCVQKYGEIDGKRIFEERQIKWYKSLSKSFSQYNITQSYVAIELISNICEYLGIEVPTTEYGLFNQYAKNHVFYDLTIGNKMLEFQGDFWHANPKLYDENWINPVTHLSAKDCWEKDEQKKKVAEENGFEIMCVWESDYDANKKQILEKCIQFFKS
jgi:hypothetical protein